jgi:hypothetical protein
MAMFNQVFENFNEAAQVTVQMQQEMFKAWVKLWPGIPTATPSWGEQVQQFQKKWAKTVGEMIKQHKEVTEAHFKAGLQNIERAFQVGEAKTTEELRSKSLELWQKCFDDLRQVYEAQLHSFETVIQKWTELAAKPAA